MSNDKFVDEFLKTVQNFIDVPIGYVSLGAERNAGKFLKG